MPIMVDLTPADLFDDVHYNRLTAVLRKVVQDTVNNDLLTTLLWGADASGDRILRVRYPSGKISEIKWDQALKKWTISADGGAHSPLVTDAGLAAALPKATTTTYGAVKISSGPATVGDPIAVETGDTRMLSQAQKDDLTDGADSTAHVHLADRARANHTGTQTLATISDVTMTVANLNTLDDGLDTTLHFHAADRARANHTGTQTLATIGDVTMSVASLNSLDDGVDSTLHFHAADRVRANHTGTSPTMDFAGNEIENVVIDARATDPGAPAEGQHWYADDLHAARVHQKIGTKSTVVAYATNAAASAEIANTAAQTDFSIDLPVPASALEAGADIDVDYGGKYSSDVAAGLTFTLRVKIGAVVLASTGAIAVPASAVDQAFGGRARIHVRAGGAVGSAVAQIAGEVDGAGGAASRRGRAAPQAIDFTAGNPVKISIEMSAAHADNKATLEMLAAHVAA